jgi:uncharacterized protein YqhQ
MENKESPAGRQGSHSYGGQAVLEGVMFRGRDHWSIAVRRPDGTIATEAFYLERNVMRTRFWKIPILRGVLMLYDTLALGFRALQYSAERAFPDEVEVSGKDFAFSSVVAVVLAIGLFVLLPLYGTRLVVGPQTASNSFAFSALEGLLRLTVFVGYLGAISLMPDIRRVFQYHGAEHQTIHAYESGRPLTAEEAARFSPLHVSCGTSFLVLVLLIMVILHAFIRGPFLVAFLIRLALVPVVAGLSYELIRIFRSHEDNLLVKMVSAPGLLVQRLTTRRPDLPQLEVAVESLKALLEVEQGRSVAPGGSEDAAREHTALSERGSETSQENDTIQEREDPPALGHDGQLASEIPVSSGALSLETIDKTGGTPLP